jgi:ethanolamine ammonia-lyase small subunit
MNEERTDFARSSAWQALRQWTPARVALGRAGGSLPTAALLDFRFAHARARDALSRPLDEERFVQSLEAVGGEAILRLHSAASSFDEFLLRPDLGRRLLPDSIERLKSFAGPPPDLVLLVSEGLLTLAVETHAVAVLRELLPLLHAEGWRLSPLCLVHHGRVAVQDHVGELLGAHLALILLGERPGLISPDSLGAYLVHQPRCGNTDAHRNCVSNINAHGLSAVQAAAKLHWLLTEARRRQASGVELKDEFDPTRQIEKSGSDDGCSPPRLRS